MLKQMWEKLDAYTRRVTDRTERAINPRNEWGGYSRRLKMPVFTGWQDHVRSVDGQMRVMVSDLDWTNAAGVNNQEYWVAHALEHGGEAAFFLIKAKEPQGTPRQVEWLDDSRAMCGPIERVGRQAFIRATRQVVL